MIQKNRNTLKKCPSDKIRQGLQQKFSLKIVHACTRTSAVVQQDL